MNMSIQQSAYHQGQLTSPPNASASSTGALSATSSLAALNLPANNLNQVQSPRSSFQSVPAPVPGPSLSALQPSSFVTQLAVRNDMPPPSITVPLATGGGGRAALTAALKRPTVSGTAAIAGSGMAAPPALQAIPPGSIIPIPQQMLQTQRTPMSGASAGSSSGQQPAKKKRRLADKSLHPAIKQIVPESKAYMDLLSFERKLDYTISRKRTEIQEALRKPQKIKKKLRIFVSHTFTPGKPEMESVEQSYPMWELRVEGRLLEDLSKAASNVESSKSSAAETTKSRRKFSSFFRSLVIELDRDLYGPDNHLVEWHRSATTQETDGFQVKRIGDKSVKCAIMLMLEYTPPHYKLDTRLARILGLIVGTKANIFTHLWEYIKRNRLQDTTHPDFINLDAALSVIFNASRIRMQEVAQRLQPLLYPPDPIVIHHLITTDNSEGRKTACYDVDVDVDDPAKSHMTNFFHAVSQTQEIQLLDNKICETVELINQLRTNREFYLSFANDPQTFIARWIQSQASDLKTMTDVVGVPEAERRADHYQGDWSREAIHRYFFGKLQQRRSELEQALNVK